MKKILITTALTAGMVMSGSAMAGALLTPAQTQGFSFTTLDESTQLSFSGFDSGLGTLHSVHLEWTMDKSLNNDIINVNAGPSDIGNPTPVSATSTTTFSVVGGSASLTSMNALTTPGFTGSVPGGGAITTVGSASDPSLADMTWICDDGSCLAGGGTAVSSAVLAAFIGGANLFDVDITNVGTQGGSVPPGVFTGNNGSATGTVSVIYDYDAVTQPPVPEPATMAMLGLGLSLVGLQGAARRRKQAK